MKKTFTLLAFLFLLQTAFAQQWIDQKYSYDSLLNVTYGTAVNFNGQTDTLRMDIYLPQCDDVNHVSRRPLMLWVHGGSFLAGDKNDPSITNLCKIFARRGYVTASIDYRLGFIADDAAWTCNYPGYPCVFAGDTAEWYRSYYRSVQDGKGALRYLINRNAQFRIDTANVFVAGESAGSFVAIGIALLDTAVERRPETFALSALPSPDAGTLTCQYNVGETFPNSTVNRPDLGGIDGTIEPTTVNYTIKGIGNMYGGMVNNLLQYHKAGSPKPAIFSFHQPCDIIVPIDSNRVDWGLSWCFSNCYSCYGIANTPKVYGSRVMSNWNTSNSYGYTIHNEFTTTTFPYQCLFVPGSCADQVNNPCHAYDNVTTRQTNLANFFAPYVTTNPICDTMLFTGAPDEIGFGRSVKLYPNPVNGQSQVTIETAYFAGATVKVLDLRGNVVITMQPLRGKTTTLGLANLAAGMYVLVLQDASGGTVTRKLVKE